MQLVSLRRLIDSGGDLEGALRRLIGILVEALAVHALTGDPVDREQFQGTLRKLNADLSATRDERRLLITGGEIIKTLEGYARSLERFHQIRGREFHNMLSLLVHKMLEAADHNDAACRRLLEIERNLRTASQVDDVRLLRARMEDALTGISLEATHHASHSAELRQHTKGLEEHLGPIEAEQSPAKGGIERTTGLPDRDAALNALREAMGAVGQVFAVAFCVERFSTIARRYGQAAAESVLMIYAQHVAQRLGREDQLFHWRGPGMVALLVGRGSKATVAMEARRVCAARFEYSVQIDDREVLIPVSGACIVARLRDFDGIHDVTSLFDRFVGERSCEAQRQEE